MTNASQLCCNIDQTTTKRSGPAGARRNEAKVIKFASGIHHRGAAQNINRIATLPRAIFSQKISLSHPRCPVIPLDISFKHQHHLKRRLVRRHESVD